MDEHQTTTHQKILWFFIGVALTLAYHYFFPAKQEPIVIPEPKSVEQTAPQPERQQEPPPLDLKDLAGLFPDSFPPGFEAIVNGKALQLSLKIYQDDDGIVYQVMHDNYKFYRGFFFKPTTDPVPKWYPVEELPWQVAADSAQADLDKMAEEKNWKSIETVSILAQRNLRDESKLLN